ncbi:MAG TPA: hypothetical protein VGB42_09945 [Candidatus Thermoplasmatota archaeon]
MASKRKDVVFWGWLLDFEDDGSGMAFEKRFLRTDGRTVLEVGTVKPAAYDFSGVALPTLEDAHSHLADRGLRVRPGMALADVVRPPDGVKHQYLEAAPPEEIVANLAAGLNDLVAGGATRTHEFREGGMAGAALFRQAQRRLPKERAAHMAPVLLGRPGDIAPPPRGDERAFFRGLDDLLRTCDGLGLSAISDGDPAWNTEVARAARARGKVVEVHASEEVREPVDRLLEAGVSQAVHMIRGTGDDFRALAEGGVSVAVCTRSNEFFGLRAPVRAMVEAGVELRIGTDNAFLGAVDMFEEARAFARVHMQAARLKPIQIVAAMVRRQGINEGAPIAPREGARPDLLFLDIQAERPERDIIARGAREKVTAVVGEQGVSDG